MIPTHSRLGVFPQKDVYKNILSALTHGNPKPKPPVTH